MRIRSVIDANLVIVPDIFGKRDPVMQFGRSLALFYRQVDIIDPYEGVCVETPDEAAAYAAFQRHCGLDRLTDRVRAAAETSGRILDFIGFSVGAAAVWRVSDSLSPHKVRQGTCFYGSRIREHADLAPAFPIELIFPRFEPHFDVRALMETLGCVEQVVCTATDYLHGFMNPLADNHDPVGYQRFLTHLKTKARQPHVH